MPKKSSKKIAELRKMRSQLARNRTISHSCRSFDVNRYIRHENFFDESRNLKMEETELMLKEKMDVMDMRNQWSKWLLRCVVFIVFSDIVLVLLMGKGLLNFADNSTIVIVTIIDGVLKVLGLAIIVVKFLFNTKTLGKNND